MLLIYQTDIKGGKLGRYPAVETICVSERCDIEWFGTNVSMIRFSNICVCHPSSVPGGGTGAWKDDVAEVISHYGKGKRSRPMARRDVKRWQLMS